MSVAGSLLIWYAAALHVAWGVCLLLDPSSRGIVGLYLLAIVFPGPLLVFVCFAVAVLAVWGTLVPKSMLQIFFLAPQQFVLFLSAASSVHCVLRGAYADGVIHPPVFIGADQVNSALLFVFYCWSLFLAYRRSVDLLSVEVRNGGVRPD